MDNLNLQPNEYYRINGTKRVLFWNGEKWQKPEKNNLGKYIFLSELEKQPTVKKVELVNISEL